MKTYIQHIYKHLLHWGVKVEYVEVIRQAEDSRKFYVEHINRIKMGREQGIFSGPSIPLQKWLSSIHRPDQLIEEWEDNGDQKETKKA